MLHLGAQHTPEISLTESKMNLTRLLAPIALALRASGCVVRTYSLGQFSFTPVSADTVLLTYRAEQDTACGALKVPSPVWATSLYTKRGGHWVNVLYQHTPVARS
jgi:hypothetical protein